MDSYIPLSLQHEFERLFGQSQAVLPAVAVAFVSLIAFVAWKKQHRTFRLLPEPEGAKFIWGHEKQSFMQQPGQAYKQWMKQLGLTYRIKAAFRAPDVLVLCDPEGIAYILQKRIYDYHHSKVVRPRIGRLLGKGLGWIEGEKEHKRMRNVISPALSSEAIKKNASDIRESASLVIENLTGMIIGEGGRTTLNMLDWTGKATLNIIGRVAFLHDFQAGESEDAKAILNSRKAGVSPIIRYAGFLTLMLLRRFPILNDLPIEAIQAQGTMKMTIQRGVAKEMVKRNQIQAGDKAYNKDVLSRLLIAEQEKKLSHQELYEQISTVAVSGHETTTQTLGFTIWNLARFPETQKKLREEVISFGKEPTFDDFQTKLPYLDAVLKETLRLYPGLANMERIAMRDDVIPLQQPVVLKDGTTTREVVIKAGQTIIIPAMAIQRSDEVWTDGDAFRPERWLEELPEREKLPGGWANTLAFGDGPRNCVGYKLAIFNYKVILTNLIQRFNFRDTGAEISLRIASSLQPFVKGKEDEGAQIPVVVEML